MSLYKWSLKTTDQNTNFEVTCKKSVVSEKYHKTEHKKR